MANLDTAAKRYAGLTFCRRGVPRPSGSNANTTLERGQLVGTYGAFTFSGPVVPVAAPVAPVGFPTATESAAILRTAAPMQRWMGKVGDALSDLLLVEPYRVDPTGVAVTDNAAFQAAVTTTAVSGGDIIIGPGNLNITAPITGWPVGGSFALGNIKAIRVRGSGRGVTFITYAPSVSTFMVTLGDGVNIAAFFEFSGITFVGGDNSLAGIFEFVDPCYSCSIEKNQFLGNGGTIGDAIRGTGQVNANSFHHIADNTFKYWANGIAGSGFFNSNEIENNSFESVTTGINLAKIGADTMGGSTNSIFSNEFDGSTVTGIKTRDNGNHNLIVMNRFDGVTTNVDLATVSNELRSNVMNAGAVTISGAAVGTTLIDQWDTNPTGWGDPTGTLDRTTFAQGSVTTAELAKRVAALIIDQKAQGRLRS